MATSGWSVAVAGVVALFGTVTQASAQVAARSLALDGQGELTAVLHDAGLSTVQAGGGWVCPAVHGPGRVVRGMVGGRLLLTGDVGAHHGQANGCSWVRTSGVVQAREVLGAHVPVEGQGLALVLTVDTSAGVATPMLARSNDGGQTTHRTETFAMAEVGDAGMMGDGSTLAIVGRRTGDAAAQAPWRLWWSEDLGATFVEHTLAWSGDALRPAALVAGQPWLWAGDALARVDRETGALTVERAFAGAEAGAADAVAAGLDGAVWVAAGAEGLWRRGEDGAWEAVAAFEGVATAVRARGARVWAGTEAARYGEALARVSGDGGETWAVAASLDDLAAPAACQALLTQQCKVERAAWDASLRDPEPEPEPEPEPGSDGCAAAGGRGVGGAWAMVIGTALAALTRRWRSGLRVPKQAQVRAHLDNSSRRLRYCADPRPGCRAEKSIPFGRLRSMDRVLTSRRTPWLLVPVTLVTFGLLACDMGLQKELDEKKAQRFAAAAAAIDAIEAARVEEQRATMPAKGAEPAAGAKHPMFEWRKRIAESRDEEVLNKLAEDFKGTPAQQSAIDGAAFVRESVAYWKGEGNLERYVKFLESYLADGAKKLKAAEEAGNKEFKQRPFLAEAAFDLLFLHAARHYLFEKSDAASQLVTSFPYWQLAFGFPSRARESFSDYVTRVCRASRLAERCKGVPHEVRPLAINKPYLEWLRERAAEFVKAYDVALYKDVITAYDQTLSAALEATPDLTEDPVLPSTWSDASGMSGLMVAMSPKKGVMLHDQQLAESFSGKLPGDFASKASELVNGLKANEGNTVDYERVVLEAPGDIDGGTLTKIVSAFPRELVRQFILVGRKRIDESLRRTGILLRIPTEEEGKTTSYQFSGDAAKQSCDFLGIAGRPPIGRKEPGAYLVVDKDRVRAAKLSRDEAGELVVGDVDFTATPDELDKIGEWAEKNPGIVRMFVPGSFSYDRLMTLASSVMHKCQDAEVAFDERGEQKVTIKCSKAEDRDVTLVFAVCN